MVWFPQKEPMAWLRGAVSLLPVVGPAVDATDAASHGDRMGAAVELCTVALDLCSTFGPGATSRVSLLATKIGSQVVRHVGRMAKRRVVAQATWQSALRTVATSSTASRHVVKTGLKHRLKSEALRVALKCGITAPPSLVKATSRLTGPPINKK
mmetsp:Transcript_60878/g.120578  ORF Transcript_60878/g.120578 Transcript_60878/m.120578 type:complete len:154 (-) Transcript_60878:109-570(-)